MEENYAFQSAFNEKFNVFTRKIIRLLSENSRLSVSEIASGVNLSRNTARQRIRKAEEEFGIRYTVEFNEEALGLTHPHVILVKFTRKPDYGEVKRILAQSHIPQIAARVNGNYDMLIYANAGSTKEYVYWDKTTQVQLSKYGVLWQPSDLAFMHLGFCPLRNALIENLDVEKKYKDMLLLLNEDSRISFSEMSKRLGIHFNTVAYNFNKLMKAGYIKRFTIVMSKPPAVSMTSIFGKYIIAEGFEEDSMKMRKEISWMDDRAPLISRCLFSAQLVGSYDFFFVGVYDSEKVGEERLVKYYRKRFKRHKVKTMHGSIGDVLVGNFPVRSIDDRKEFNMIKWIPNAQPQVTKFVPERGA
jgi:DNA-binding Lrp family transcriptional regulator